MQSIDRIMYTGIHLGEGKRQLECGIYIFRDMVRNLGDIPVSADRLKMVFIK